MSTKNTMEYRGYTARVEFDSDDGLFYGDVIDLRDMIAFSGESVQELTESFHRAVDTYLEFCDERGVDPEKPFRGKIQLRIEPDLHRSAAIAAASEGISINAFLSRCVKQGLKSDPQLPQEVIHIHHHAVIRQATSHVVPLPRTGPESSNELMSMGGQVFFSKGFRASATSNPMELQNAKEESRLYS